MCACLGVCVAAMRFDIHAPIATRLHAHTEDFPGNVLQPISISWTYQEGCISKVHTERSHSYGNSQD